jgi:putative transposase
MGNVQTRLFMHMILTTRRSAPFITPDLEAGLHERLAEIVKEERCQPLAIGGGEEHVHVLVRYRATTVPSKFFARLQTESARWVQQEFPEFDGFAWEDAEIMFTISGEEVPREAEKILMQAATHRNVTYREELVKVLSEAGIEFTEEELPG